MHDIIYGYKISFRETKIKQDMSAEFASLLNVCPSVRSLKYVYIFLVIAMLISHLCVYSLYSISKCALQIKTLTDISSGIHSELHSLTMLK